MKEIPLTKGKVAIVDDDDFDRLNNYSWYYNNSGYVARKLRTKGVQTTILMHREIMNPPKGMVIDHINHNPLDNRKENLRITTQSFNIRHSKLRKNNTSGFIGITKVKRKKEWMAQLTLNRKCINLGYYETPEEAAKVYQDYVRKLWEEAGHEYIPISEVCND